jgi:DNA-binding GntR family transcriptional regulator
MNAFVDNQNTELTVDRSARTLRELTLEKLRDAILDFRFQPGERLIERALCDRLGVSRTVVREVLRHLEAEGLVETIQNQGPAVTRPDPSNAAQVYEIRALLEAEAAVACAAIATPADVAHLSQAVDTIQAAFDADNSRGVLKATTDFYEVLFKIAGKSVAWSVVQSLNARINHLRAMTIATPGRSRDAIAEMRRIVAAIQKHDGDAARQASMAHVEAVAQLARQVLSP